MRPLQPGRVVTRYVPTFLALTIFAWASAGCGGGDSEEDTDGDGETVTVSGLIAPNPSGGRIGLRTGPGTKSAGSADQVVAIPLPDGAVDPAFASSIQTATLAADGSFSLELAETMDYQGETKKIDWVLMQIDSSQPTKAEQFVGFLSLPDEDNTLMKLPVSEAATSEIALGEFTTDDAGEATSDQTIDASADSFELTADALKEIAKTDDVLRGAKNFWINYDAEAGTYYHSELGFGFKAAPSTALNAYADPTDLEFEGYIVTLATNDSSATAAGICAGTSVAALNVPAAEGFRTKWSGSTTYESASIIDGLSSDLGGAFSSTGSGCMNSFMGASSDGGGSGYRFNIGSDLSILDILTGYWTYTLDDVVKGSFDFAASNPGNAVGNAVSAYVPVIKVNTGAADAITSIDLKWYLWDPNTELYAEVTDTALIDASMGSMFYLEVKNYSGQEQMFPLDGGVTSISNFDDDWTFTSSGLVLDGVEGGYIDISYTMNGLNYVFEWEG